jgi:predicted nucleic acid-binding protein
MKGQPEAVDIVRHAPVIGLSTIVLGELLGGFAAGSRRSTNLRLLERFLTSRRVRVLPVEQATAERYSIIYVELKRRGRPIPTNDLWIAATALCNGLAVFSYDHHFTWIDGIAAGQTLADFQT